jgi:phosphoglycerate dehydrogenase-like enzyme
MSATIHVLAQVRESLIRRIGEALPDVAVSAIPADGAIPPGVRGDVLLTLPWGTPNIADALGRGVRWVHVIGTGVDRFPMALLDGRPLTCSRGGSAVPIAEWVLAVMLAFAKRLPDAWIHDVPTEGWSRTHLETLHGRTLGLVGIGGIGSAVARLALPFGMRVRACRRTSAPSEVAGVEIVGSLAELVASADHVVVAAAATAATRHLIDARVLAAAKPGAHLVNVARGSLVDPEALRVALDAGRVAMASLDAVEPEPLPAGHWMYGHPRVRLSPHVSWNMPGAAELLLDAFIDNLRRWRDGRPLIGVVDPTAGY